MIIAVVGTGTGIGKTHAAVALLMHLRAAGHRVLGWKPMESGVTGEVGEDEAALRQACGEAAPTLRFAAPLAPAQAARLQGEGVDADALVARLGELAARWPLLVVELAGGWFSPFDDQLDNAQWLANLPPPLRQRLRLVLIAPDRLGVLHDVSATVRAAAGLGLAPVAVALSATAQPDRSSGDNRAELAQRALTRALVLLELPRRPAAELAASAAIAELAAAALGAG